MARPISAAWPLRRPDGAVVEALPGYRRFMPALMPRRTESVVYFDQQVRTAAAEALVAETREAHPGLHATFFDVVLWALVHTFDRHPRLNRFVAGGRIYQRDGIWLSFTAKSELTEEGTLLEVKRNFDPHLSFAAMAREIHDATAATRAGAHGLADRELEAFLHLPPILRRGVVRVAGAANALNLLPRAFVEGDPFFASAFVTNLGSLGLDAAFHHLYEYGTIPIFCTIGVIREGLVIDGGTPAVARTASIKFTYDERVEDGFSAGKALDDFKAMVENPRQLIPST